MDRKQIEAIRKQYEVIDAMIVENNKDIARNYIMRGQEVPPDVYRLAQTTAHDFEMEEKLRKIQEDPEKYYREARKKARAEIDKEMRDELLRPFKRALDWIFRRR